MLKIIGFLLIVIRGFGVDIVIEQPLTKPSSKY